MNSPHKKRTIILGVDPGLTATGLALIDITGDVVKHRPEHWPVQHCPKLLARATIRTLRPRTNAIRLLDLCQRFRERVDGWYGAEAPLILGRDIVVVMEDPTDYNPTAHRRPERRSNTSLVGAAFGALLVEIHKSFDCKLEMVPSQDWLPQTRTGNFTHNMKHKQARETLKTIFPFLAECTDDKTFAGGVAMYWHLGGRVSL